MKTLKISAVLLIILLSQFTLPAQNIPLIKFTDTSCFQTARPVRLIAGQQVLVQCDTAFIINKSRFRLYEKARAFILDTNKLNYKSAIEEYEKDLNKASEVYNAIYNKYMIMSEEYGRSLDMNIKELTLVRKDLVKAQSDLLAARDELGKVKKNLAAHQRLKLAGKLLYGLTGAAIGIGFFSLLLN